MGERRQAAVAPAAGRRSRAPPAMVPLGVTTCASNRPAQHTCASWACARGHDDELRAVSLRPSSVILDAANTE